MGADSTVLVKSSDVETLVQKIKEELGGMPNITIECSGAESSIRLGILVSVFCSFYLASHLVFFSHCHVA